MGINIQKMDPTELWMHAGSLETRGEYEQAAKIMEKAAQMGEILAQDNLAQYYEKGIGVKQDYAKAAELYEEVALSPEPSIFGGMPKAPHCAAAFALGRLYENGLLPNASMQEAIKWYKYSAELGEADANLKLAELYFEGRGVEQNYAESLNCISDALYCNMSFNYDKLFDLCQKLLGKVEGSEWVILSIIADCYERGWGVEMDESKADEYHKKAYELQKKEFGVEKTGSGFAF